MFPQIFGKYVLERELASGGMAVVYLATLRGAGGFEKRLVVKQIRAELASDAAFVERLVAEAKTTVGLSHPNIVPVYELGVEQGVYFIAMELAQGLTLAELLQANGRLSPEEGAYLGVEICRALDYAHRKAGIVHRDATPRNVLVDDEGAVRLIDFGIATPVTAPGAARERVFGSPGHMPVEQLRGGRLTPATDVFAVGALLIEAWTSKAPFRRAARAESDAALSTPPPALSTVEPRLAPLDDLIARAVAYDAAERPQTAEELARPLREFLRSADLGDIARRLGERVRVARRASAPRVGSGGAARADAGSGGGRAQSASGAEGTRPIGARRSSPSVQTSPTRPIASSVITETFAARDEVVEWARRASEFPDPLEVLGLGDDPPAPESGPGAIPPAPGAEAPAEPPRPRRRLAGGVAALAIVAGVAGVAGSRVGPSGREAGGAPDSPTTPLVMSSPSGGSAAPVRSGPPDLVESAAVRSSPAAPVPASPPRLVPSSSSPAGASLAAPPASPSQGPEDRSATLTITADLAARVTIDGASYGVTPLRGLKRAPGKHHVALVSVELDERLTTTVDARPGQAISIHAEFTRPVPALRVR